MKIKGAIKIWRYEKLVCAPQKIWISLDVWFTTKSSYYKSFWIIIKFQLGII